MFKIHKCADGNFFLIPFRSLIYSDIGIALLLQQTSSDERLKKCVIFARQQEIKTLCEWTKETIFTIFLSATLICYSAHRNVFNGVLMWKYYFSKRNGKKEWVNFFYSIVLCFISSRFIMFSIRDFPFIHTKYFCRPSFFLLFLPEIKAIWR